MFVLNSPFLIFENYLWQRLINQPYCSMNCEFKARIRHGNPCQQSISCPISKIGCFVTFLKPSVSSRSHQNYGRVNYSELFRIHVNYVLVSCVLRFMVLYAFISMYFVSTANVMFQFFCHHFADAERDANYFTLIWDQFSDLIRDIWNILKVVLLGSLSSLV